MFCRVIKYRGLTGACFKVLKACWCVSSLDIFAHECIKGSRYMCKL